MDITLTDPARAGARATAEANPRAASVLVLETEDAHYAYLPRPAELARVEPSVARALELYSSGVRALDLRRLLQRSFGRQQTRQALAGLRSLVRSGLLDSEPQAPDRRKNRIQGYLRHHPRNLMLLVSEACNLRCRYCYEVSSSFHRDRGLLSNERAVEIIRRYFDESGDRKNLLITFFGGELLLAFETIRHAVAAAKELAGASGKIVQFSMTTNLTLMTEEIADYLVDNRFALMVSIDGDREAHDRNRVDRKGRGTYDTVVRNLRSLLQKQRAAGMQAFRIGNTLTGIDESRITRYYDDLLAGFEEKCRGCWARHICGGECPWYLSLSDGSVGLPDDDHCRIRRRSIREGLRLFAVAMEKAPQALRTLLEKGELLTRAADQVPGKQPDPISNPPS